MDAARRADDDGLFRARLPVYVYRRHRPARDELMALAALYGHVHDRAGLRRFIPNVSGRAIVGI